ncbi:universal stress protein, partial [Streptomyces klenkii]
ASADADLVVVALHRQHPPGPSIGPHLGHALRALLRRATCPLLLVPAPVAARAD